MSFSVLEPDRLDDIVGILADDPGAVVYAGGVQLLTDIKLGLARPSVLASLKHVVDVRGVESNADAVDLGAATRLSEVASHPVARRFAPLMADACRDVGNVRVRGRATVGGNVCLRDAKSDLLPVLLVHDARIHVAGNGARRKSSVEEFIERGLQSRDEVVERVLLDVFGEGWSFGRRRRAHLVKPVLSAAVAVRCDGEQICDARAALAGLALRPIRLGRLESQLIGRLRADAVPQIEEVVEIVAGLQATDEPDASAGYKRRLAGALLIDSIGCALGRCECRRCSVLWP